MNLSAPFLCEFFSEPMTKALPYVDILFGNETVIIVASFLLFIFCFSFFFVFFFILSFANFLASLILLIHVYFFQLFFAKKKCFSLLFNFLNCVIL